MQNMKSSHLRNSKPTSMKSIFKSTAVVFLLFISFIVSALTEPKPTNISNHPSTKSTSPKIQVAVLLDVSNSMDGLIEQAKAQLWNMVSTMGKAECNGKTPQIEIALYEYGRPDNGSANGYVKQISGFTTDLDQLSKQLFGLKTNGGDEYCGKVIYTSLDELAWDNAGNNYKVIFIAGNEDFLQGNITYTKACSEAKQKGVIVNTIYCGDRMQGIREHWNLNSECGNGSYSNINQDAKIEEIPTPYDSAILALNTKLNGTYISYGYHGDVAFADQKEVDKLNYSANRSVAVKRATVKGKKELYKNNRWDVVDAAADDKNFYKTLDKNTLTDSLRTKTTEELKQIVTVKQQERDSIQTEIGRLAAQRDAFIAAERAKNAATKNTVTLETEIEKIIKQQAKLYNMIIK